MPDKSGDSGGREDFRRPGRYKVLSDGPGLENRVWRRRSNDELDRLYGQPMPVESTGRGTWNKWAMLNMPKECSWQRATWREGEDNHICGRKTS